MTSAKDRPVSPTIQTLLATKPPANVKSTPRSAKIPNVNQAAVQKYRLLFKLLFSRPGEFFDRVKTRAEGMASPRQSAAEAQGLDLAAMLDQSSEYLGMDLNGFLHDADAEAMRAHIAAERALLDRPASA